MRAYAAPDIAVAETLPATGATARTASPQAAFEAVIIVLPGFSHLSLAAIVEALRCANEAAGQAVFRWRLAGMAIGAVESASMVEVRATSDLAHERRAAFADAHPWAVFICAGTGIEKRASPELLGLLRVYSRQQVPLFALGGGAWLLAEAGVMRNGPCTVHWKSMAAFAELHHELHIADALYVTHGRITSCAGELAALDLVISLLRNQCGEDMARGICDLLLADRWRAGHDRQTLPMRMRPGATNLPLMHTIRLMEDNLQAPLSMNAIANRAGISRRQIERLFARYLDTTPWSYYVGLRLERSRRLIVQTALPITEIALACGFFTASHFSRCFRDCYGFSPSLLRRTPGA